MAGVVSADVRAMRSAPHWLQNREPAGFGAEHPGQVITVTLADPADADNGAAPSHCTEQRPPMMEHPRNDAGWIEVICGPMFSGKSEELIRRLRRAAIAKQRVQVFKPAIDRRYDDTRIMSHSAQSLDAVALPDVEGLVRAVVAGTQVVGIDEAQFFGPTLVSAVQRMADGGVRVIIAGLDQDYLGRPFEPVPQLLAIAEQITKCSAICTQCGGTASRSFRLSGGAERVQVGAADAYEARCRACYLAATTGGAR